MKERLGKRPKDMSSGRWKASTAHPSISDGKAVLLQWKRWGMLSFL